LESRAGEPIPEESVGVAPEIVEKALEQATGKLIDEIMKVRSLISNVRRAIERRADLLRIGRASEPEQLCYLSVDSGFTAPSVELVGGYLGIIIVATVLYGSRCGRSSVDSKLYAKLWFNEDLTEGVAKYYERLTSRRLLEEKSKGRLSFDVLLLDGEIVPRGFASRIAGGEDVLSRTVEVTGEVLRLADKTDTAIVGVLKRSYSRDIVNILGFHELRLSDKAVLSLVLSPGEYLVAGNHIDIYNELLRLRGKPGVNRRWLETRIRWYESLVNNMPEGYAVKLAFYRAHRTIYPTSTKIEYVTSDSLDEDKLISSLMHVSAGSGIPAPIDYADVFSAVTRELRQTAYQKLLAEVAKRASGESRDILSLLSLMNPEKLMHIIG